MCTYKIIYIHQAHICTLLFFFCPFSTCHFFYFCQKYLPFEHDFESEEGHFLPLEEGVKHLPNPHICILSSKTQKKLRIFASFPLLFSVVRILYIIYINTPFNRCRRWYNEILVSCFFFFTKQQKSPIKERKLTSTLFGIFGALISKFCKKSE